MYYYKFIADTEYCGTQTEFLQVFKEKPTEETLNAIADELAYDNACDYDDFESEEMERTWYYESAWCEWKEITEEEYFAEMPYSLRAL